MARFLVGVVILTVLGMSSGLRYQHKNHGIRNHQNLHETSELKTTAENVAPSIVEDKEEIEVAIPIGVDQDPPNQEISFVASVQQAPVKDKPKPINGQTQINEESSEESSEESKAPMPEFLPVPAPLTESGNPTGTVVSSDAKPVNGVNKAEVEQVPAPVVAEGEQAQLVTPAIVIGSFETVPSTQGSNAQGTSQTNLPIAPTPLQPMNDFITALMSQLSPLGYMFNKPFNFQPRPQTLLNNKPVSVQSLTPSQVGISNKPSSQSVLLALMSPQGNFVSSNAASSTTQVQPATASVAQSAETPNTKFWQLPWDVKPMTFPQAINVIFPTCNQQCEADNKVGYSDDSPCLNFNCKCPVFGSLAQYTKIGGLCDDGTCNAYCKKPYKKTPNVQGSVSVFDNSKIAKSSGESSNKDGGIEVELEIGGGFDQFENFGFEYMHGGKCELHSGYTGSEIICMCKCLMGDRNLPYYSPVPTNGVGAVG